MVTGLAGFLTLIYHDNKTLAVLGILFCLFYGQGRSAQAEELPSAGAGEHPAAEPEQVADGNQGGNFNVFEYRVEGNTKLPRGKVEEAVYPFLGESKNIADVDKAREALEKAYHQAGYLTALVDIPEQDVKGGVVRLNVTEGKVGRLRVKGSRYFSLGRIKELAPSVAEGEVPYFPEVQKDMTALNRGGDKRITPVMKAGKVFGTVDVDLKVEDTLPLHASLELNDKHSFNTSRLRLAGSIRYDNLWQREHSLSFQFQTAPENTEQVKVLSASYLYRFDDSNTMLSFYGVKTNSNVASVGGISVLGNGRIFGARVILPLPSLDNFYHSISLGADYKDFGEDIQFGSDTSSTPISYMPFSAQYNATLQDESGQTQFLGSAVFGVRDLVGEDNEFAAKRFGAHANFVVLKADLQRTQKLPYGLQLYARLDGQFSGQPLISNEQYAAGGADSVRGYLESESMGDHALHSTLELRSPSLFPTAEWIQELRLLAFYDIAKLHVNRAQVSEQQNFLLSSRGVGLRFQGWKNLNASLDAAWPLRDGEHTLRGDLEGHMRLWYEF